MQMPGRTTRRRKGWGGMATLVAMAALCVSVPAGAQQDRPDPARRSLQGVVVDSAGRGIDGASVLIPRTQQSTRTDSLGEFLFTNNPTGAFTLIVRRLGFRPETLAVTVADTAKLVTVRVRMTVFPQQLAEVAIEARAEAYKSRLAGFEERRARRVGHFITREQIDRHAGSNVTDLLREVPGVRVGRLNGLEHAVRIRGASCAPLVYIDGYPARAFELDLDDFEARSVEGIEVYSSGSSIPQQFLGTGAELQCGVIAIWSRPSRSSRSPG